MTLAAHRRLGPDDPKAQTPSNWKGQNLLGRTLEQVRAELSAGRQRRARAAPEPESGSAAREGADQEVGPGGAPPHADAQVEEVGDDSWETEMDREVRTCDAPGRSRDGTPDGLDHRALSGRRAILVMGGAFNPPHPGHVGALAAAKRAAEESGVEVITKQPHPANMFIFPLLYEYAFNACTHLPPFKPCDGCR